ncbi:MAG: YkgJ family cysteine cluster protein [Chlorobi bacterium]|nr:YkgJ family cysteine cluster protein [Chlorobiota bacterium]
MPDFKQKFYDITHLVQTEFDRSLELYGSKIQCRRGCSKCCSQIFRITPLDGWIIREHVKTLPLERQAELKQKAKEYLEKVPLIKGDLGGLETDHSAKNESLPFSKGEFAKREGVKSTDHPVSSSHPSLTKEGSINPPCPALGPEGECTIYEARPVVCRRFGMPIYDYKNPQNVYACDLNFKAGEEIRDDKLIPNQTEIGKKWDELKDEFGAGATTIAEAILGS